MAQPLAFERQPAALAIIEPRFLAQQFFENTDFFLQILNHLLLIAIQLASDAEQRHQLGRADESIRIQHHLGHRPNRRGGSQHGFNQLATRANQHAHQRLGLFQRSTMDELSRPLLPAPLALIYLVRVFASERQLRIAHIFQCG